ncbi:MAG: isopenicillin N synthase family oxygenase [Acidimicrobiaceae bacterium]|nr:isopenicillin N synthase family oxygenase [Acidimicrobiaceae bacterium]
MVGLSHTQPAPGKAAVTPDGSSTADKAAVTPPTVDISAVTDHRTSAVGDRRVAAAVESAYTDAGLFVLAGHGIDEELEAAFDASRAFFALPPEVKDRVPRIDRYGYVPDRIEARDPSSAAYTGRSSLAAEYLDMGLAGEVDLEAVETLGCNGFAAAVRAYQAAALAAAHGVLEALAATLGVPGFFAARMSEPQCRLRFLHYPPTERLADGSAPVFSTPHTDYGAITLLAVDGLPGLEVLHDGAWTPVAAPGGSMIVQLGDMLARWTNDRYRSTPHRVVGSSGTDRFSIPFFVNPDPHTVVSTIPGCVTTERPERYEPVTAGEFLVSRIDSPTEPYI